MNFIYVVGGVCHNGEEPLCVCFLFHKGMERLMGQYRESEYIYKTQLVTLIGLDESSNQVHFASQTKLPKIKSVLPATIT